MQSPLVTPILLALLSFANAAGPPTLAPPSTFDSPSSLTAPGSTTTPSASRSSTMPATPTSSAQFPSLSGFSTCVTNCLQLAVSVNCSSIAEVNCYCTSQHFTQDLVNCAANSCPGELATVESLAQRFCNLASQPASLSFPSTTSRSSSSLTSSPVPTNTAPNTASGSTSSSSSASTSNAASPSAFMNTGNFGSSTFFGMGVAILGVILGAFLVE